jgi:hypothetical protein
MLVCSMPVVAGGAASLPVNGRPPATRVADQAIFFMASWGVTQGPPVSLQPGEAAMASSRPLSSA